MRKNVHPLFGLLIFATVSTSYLVLNSQKEAGLGAVEQIEVSDLIANSTQTALAKPRQNPREIPDIDPVSANLSDDERDAQARQFAEAFRAKGDDPNRANVDAVKQRHLASISNDYGEGALLRVQSGQLGRMRGMATSIPLKNVSAGDVGSLNSAVENFMTEQAEIFGINDSTAELESSSFCVGEACATKVQKKFQGLPAWDHTVSVTSRNGRVISAQGEFYEPNIASFADPKLEQSSMSSSIAEAFSIEADQVKIRNSPEFGIARSGMRDFLAYKLTNVLVAGAPYKITIDAQTGLVARRESLIKHASVSASGTDLEGNSVEFQANQNGNQYEMTDSRFPTNNKTEVFNFAGLPFLTVLDNFVKGTPPARVTSTDANNSWDPAAVSAVNNAKLVWDYYRENHSFESPSEGKDITIGVGASAEQASFWGEYNVIEFGVGQGIAAEDGLSLAISKDVMAHEMTHGVIGATSSLAYEHLSGALDEAFSDYMGTMVDPQDWFVGEDLRSPYGALRSLSNPADGIKLPQYETWKTWSGFQPSHMNDYRPLPGTKEWDWGGVHIYSGIINRALYLLAEGLTTENLGTSIGRTKTADLVFKTMTSVTDRANFDDAVNLMLTLAESDYGAPEKQAVTDAFALVGLPTLATKVSADSGAKSESETASLVAYLVPYYSQAIVSDSANSYYVYVQGLTDADPDFNSEVNVGPVNLDVWASKVRPTLVRTESGDFFLAYRGKDGKTYLYSDQSGTTETLDISLDVAHITLSQDRKKVVFSEVRSNRIYIYDYASEKTSIIEVKLPSYAEGNAGITPHYIDTLRFDPTSRFVIFDYAVCEVSAEATCEDSTYWSVGILNVTDNSLDFPLPTKAARYDIGFPAFSNLTDRYIAIDIKDNEADTDSKIETSVQIYDREDKSFTGIVSTDGSTAKKGHWGKPSFSTDDSYLTFSYKTDLGTLLYAAFLEDYAPTSAETKFKVVNPNFGDSPFTIPAVAVNKVPSLKVDQSSLNFGDIVKGSSAEKELCVENEGEFAIALGNFSESGSELTWSSAYGYLKEKTKVCSSVSLGSIGAEIGEISKTVSISHDGGNSPTPITISGYIDLDTDSDGTLNYKDTDDDGDSVLDANDAFPLDSTETIDTDADGVGNNADTDDDGDNALDVNDAYPLISVGELTDTDKDGRPNDCDEACVTKGMAADTDDDGDSVVDTNDAFPLDATESVDTDSDGVGNNADSDDDGDSMDDAFEIANSLNPLVNDADGDSDGDGLTNFQEFTDGTPLDKDSLAPVLTMPDNVTFDSTGPLTVVALGASSAEDFLDGAVTVALSRTNPFVPGLHEVTYTASDAAGNTTSAVQTLILKPMLDVPKAGQTVEGKDYTVVAFLNGQAAGYPVVVPVTFSGTATQNEDYTASAESIQIDSGTSGSLVLSITDDGQTEEDESILVTLGAPESNAVLGSVIEQEVSIVSTAVAPKVSLAVQQNGLGGSFIAADSGNVLVTLSVADVNGTHTVDWTSSDNNIVALDSSTTLQLEFDPVSMAAGLYEVLAQVTDSEIADKTFPASLVVKVSATSAPLDTDGDGIPDEQDTFDASNAIALENGTGAVYTDSGLTLVLGDSALNKGNAGIAVTEADVASSGEGTGPSSFGSDSSYNYPGGLYDFKVSGLPVAGDSVNVVIPLSPAAPANAQYRKYTDLSGWTSFVSDTSNAVKTAAGASGACPQAGSASYQSGLTQGHTCLQLTIEDGGPNDADGSANGVVDDPGGIGIIPQAIAPAAPVPAQSSGGGGGGGGCSVGKGTRDPMLPLIVLLCLVGLTRHKWRVLLRKQVG